MARPDPRLIAALRATADRISGGANYRWTHMGACNCGHLAQTLTELSPAEIHEVALEKAGDWREQVVEHCPASGYTIDHIIDLMLELGLTQRDIQALERLEDPSVMRAVPPEFTPLDHRRREHVVAYMRTWADLLDAQRRDVEHVATLAAEGRARNGRTPKAHAPAET